MNFLLVLVLFFAILLFCDAKNIPLPYVPCSAESGLEKDQYGACVKPCKEGYKRNFQRKCVPKK